jgi:SpoVK/Ycf46/Vps4 family AAA+-type ATPase
VDLAAIMNKYVGESEKNLGLLLDLAAAADAILLFDEADSLFGRRTDAQQSGERYANMLTNFLLTRIENHPGITILTTNSRERIDNAFTRRLDAIVDFPMPGFQERLDLWRSHFGQRSPSDDLCKTLASYCDISGGQIRNVVLTAAGCSPADQPIGIEPLLSALQREYQKLGRNPPAQLKQLRS